MMRKERTTNKGDTPAKGVPGAGPEGTWQGSLRLSVAELRLVLKVVNSADG